MDHPMKMAPEAETAMRLNVGSATPSWLGYFGFAALAVGTGVLFLLTVDSSRAQRGFS